MFGAKSSCVQGLFQLLCSGSAPVQVQIEVGCVQRKKVPPLLYSLSGTRRDFFGRLFQEAPETVQFVFSSAALQRETDYLVHFKLQQTLQPCHDPVCS